MDAFSNTLILKLMLIQTSLNYNPENFPGEINTLPSETVPDQTLTMREIVDRYTRGLPIDAKIWQPTSMEDEVDWLPDPRTLDLAEREELVDSYTAEIKKIKQLAADEKAAQKAALKAAETVNKELTEKQKLDKSGDATNEVS